MSFEKFTHSISQKTAIDIVLLRLNSYNKKLFHPEMVLLELILLLLAHNSALLSETEREGQCTVEPQLCRDGNRAGRQPS
jgi:hypothetical protein